MITMGIVGSQEHQNMVKALLDQFSPHLTENIQVLHIPKAMDLTPVALGKIHVLLDLSGEWKRLTLEDDYLWSNLGAGVKMIINWDHIHRFSWWEYASTPIITYGINPKACVTASSIQQDMSGNTIVQCCIQQGFITQDNKKIEPQEFTVTVGKWNQENIDLILGVVTATLLLPQ